MKVLSGVLLALACGLMSEALADTRICVKNFIFQGTDLCRAPTGRHKYIVREDRSTEALCTAVYPDERCKFNKQEFAHATTAAGEVVCVLNYNQPSITGNYCATQPNEYSYALDPWR